MQATVYWSRHMHVIKYWVAAVLFGGCTLISSCSDECSEYSIFSCKEIQKATYNTYFYYPNGTAEYLGISNGLQACGSLAHSVAASKNLTGNSEWSYICCMKANDSECLEKHR
jgi:hypothetical protein